MNDILMYFAKSLANSTLSLKKMAILMEKPWTLIDEEGEVQKLIFKKDKGLILSKNGKVTIGSWDYFPEAKALLINRVKDKLLLNEQYVDENVLILKMDGTENTFYALANENTLSYNEIPQYLNLIKCREFQIKQIRLFTGYTLQIHQGNDGIYSGNNVEAIDDNFTTFNLANGKYLAGDKSQTYYIRNNKLAGMTTNMVKKLGNGKTIEIENGVYYYKKPNIGKKVTINGETIINDRLKDTENMIYDITEGVITNIVVEEIYELKNGQRIIIEQKYPEEISAGDKIFLSASRYPVPNGSYKIKGKFWAVKVKDGRII